MTGTCRVCEEQVLVQNGRAAFHKSKTTSGACAGSDLQVIEE